MSLETAPTSQENIGRDEDLVIEIESLTKEYRLGAETVRALRGIDITIRRGEYVAIMGPSGSGKSTLLNILGCLDRPTAGTYKLGGKDVSKVSDDELSEIRCQKLGFIFQSYNLISQLNVVENIEVPLFYQGVDPRVSRERAVELATLVGLGDRLSHRPTQLSGGQQQRVAIARSLANDPLFILADEPTGNLDSATEAEILAILNDLHRAGKNIVMVTHEERIAGVASRVIRLRDGLVVSDKNERDERLAASAGAGPAEGRSA
ncbi:MAG TPA: ABC transporter ATP-binding protein [Planctomycetota bacterium]|nr:ABC transporter ATP-binding protein [Planctomycetota bacterium]